MSVVLWNTVFLLTACDHPTPIPGGDISIEDRPIGLDESGPAGFSAFDVMDALGPLSYPNADSSAAGFRSETRLADVVPIRILPDYSDAHAIVRTVYASGEVAVPSPYLRVALAVTASTDDGALNVTGRAWVRAIALDSDGIAWEFDSPLTGELPTWVQGAAAEHVDDSACADGDGASFEQHGTFGGMLTDELSFPELDVGVFWDSETLQHCRYAFEAISSARLSNPE